LTSDSPSTPTDTAPTGDNAADQPPEGPVALLKWLERLPKIAVFLAVLVITVGFLWTPGVAGAVLTLLLAGGAGFVLYATWSKRTGTATRVGRVAVVAALAALGVAKLFM
jgi:hypothetical protein